MINTLEEIIKYKELLFNLTSKELKLKYKNSLLGFLWSFLNPLMMLVVYTLAFKYIMKVEIENFTLFILIGVLPWTFFQSSIQVCTGAIVNNSGLIKKVYFPREIIPLSNILSNFINFLITLSVLFIAMGISKVQIGINILVLPLLLILLLGFTIGLGLMLAALNVRYRDTSHLVDVAFIALFYLTPIVYSLDLIPENIRVYMLLNPMTLIIQSLRECLIYNSLPKLSYLIVIIIIDVVIIKLGHLIFKKIEKEFAEEI